MFFLNSPVYAQKELADKVLALTGARTKVVWAHGIDVNKKHWGTHPPFFSLMTFDTKTEKIIELLPGPKGYSNPRIMPNGKTIIYMSGGTIYAIDWDGKNKRNIGSGFNYCNWVDPKTKIEWVYYARGEFSSPISRVQVDNPSKVEVVWKEKAQGSSAFQVSADGTRAGCLKAHPAGGVIFLKENKHEIYGSGCENGLAPDNSYRFFHMGGSVAHGGIMLYDAGGKNGRALRFGFGESWNPNWSTHSQFMTVSNPNSGKSQDVFLFKFNKDFTGFDGKVRISSAPGQDLNSHAWIEQAGLGDFMGEAPYKISFPNPGKGTWEWDFGDKKTGKGGAVSHTYKKPGDYSVTATQGKLEYTGSVKVISNVAVKVLSSTLMDASTLLITFNQSVILDDAKAKLKSGTKVVSITAGKRAADLILKLSGPLAKTDSLSFTGVKNLSKTKGVKSSATVKRPAWPKSRKNLLLLMGSKNERFHFSQKEKTFVPTELKPINIARIDPLGRLVLHGGIFAMASAGDGIPSAVKKQKAFSIETVIHTSSLKQGKNDARYIVANRAGHDDRHINFALVQKGPKLYIYLRVNMKGKSTAAKVGLTVLSDKSPNHIVVSYKPGELLCFLNGKEVKRVVQLTGDLPWRDIHFIPGSEKWGFSFGGDPGFDAIPWWGKLERLAIFARVMSKDEIESNYSVFKKGSSARPKIPRCAVRAKLIAKSKPPRAKETVYKDALILNEYEVQQVLMGKLESKKIRILQWGMINRQAAPNSKIRIGTVHKLLLEPKDKHPELGSEFIAATIDDDDDVDVYLDITPVIR
ncbi:MAG: PKD domain-containing protein [Lentisphaeria bacterium]|nr:PKD domain-containing protein [Lentisphaeria bacterium]NQZ70057.1 PKD domain-containing protein [Lentisphaeria bacterium]